MKIPAMELFHHKILHSQAFTFTKQDFIQTVVVGVL